MAGGIVALPSGEVLLRESMPTQASRDGQIVLNDALQFAEYFLQEARARQFEVLGIGVGVPELVDPSGNITSGHALAWRGLSVQEQFNRLAPAIVESDVRAAAFAEANFGAGQDYNLFAYVSVGTGISCCLVQDGRPFAGARGNALVLASSPLTTTCTVCGTVLEPILEDFASGPALVTRYNVHAVRPATRGEDVLEAVLAGDGWASEVVHSAGAALGTSVAFLINILDPEAVVIGGGLGQSGGLYWSSFVESTRHHIWGDTTRQIPILPTGLKHDTGLIGAAAAIWQQRGKSL